MKNTIIFFGIILLMTSCNQNKSKAEDDQNTSEDITSNYKGTASITQGLTEDQLVDIYDCSGGRPTGIAVIKSSDKKEWTVPASTNFTNDDFPWAMDLHNLCNGNTSENLEEAVSKLTDADIIEIDADGELFTAYIFADNYFEMYINGIPVGKDKVPFTKFNSSVVRYKVAKPYTIAMKLVDWEEHFGVGTEKSGRSDFHAGDGGMVAVIQQNNNTVAITDEDWKAQTYYTSPIKDLSCVTETGGLRVSENCDTSDSDDVSSYYGLHWEIPKGWTGANFNDSAWPNATTYTNETIGVDNKPAYTNFTDVFDEPESDAKFIWSTNVILDNLVLVRYTVK